MGEERKTVDIICEAGGKMRKIEKRIDHIWIDVRSCNIWL